MRMRIILEVTLLVFLLGTSIEGLFFQYPKNALIDFFQSLHKKKEVKKPPQNIHHYHLHYYPVHAQILSKQLRAPDKLELDKLHSNHLESLGWNDNGYNRVPEPDIYRTSPLSDIWPESSLTKPWDEAPDKSNQSVEHPAAASTPGIIVQVPLHQNFIIPLVHKSEKEESHPLVRFFQKISKIKNSLFSHQDDTSDTAYWEDKHNYYDQNGYYVYYPPEIGRKL